MADTPTYAKIKELLCDNGVDKLHKQGFDPEGLPPDDCLRMTYLLKACYRGDLPVVRGLLDLGASITATDVLGYTALMLACSGDEEERAELVEYLLERADVRACIDSATTGGFWRGWSALHFAARYSNADTTKRDEKGYTAAAVVRVLLRFGADATKRDEEGYTAAALARKHRKEEVAQLINNYTQFVNIGEWRPWNDYERPKSFRKATKIILLLAKM